jgi:hypothetical protein
MHTGWKTIVSLRAAQAREAYALVIGKDGAQLLDALYADTAPLWLREIPAVQTLRRVWVQSFFWEVGELRWRELVHQRLLLEP